MMYPFPRIYFGGLQADAIYRIEALDGKLSKETPAVDVDLKGDFQATAFT